MAAAPCRVACSGRGSRPDSSSPRRRRAMSVSYSAGASRLTHHAAGPCGRSAAGAGRRCAAARSRSATASAASGAPIVDLCVAHRQAVAAERIAVDAGRDERRAHQHHVDAVPARPRCAGSRRSRAARACSPRSRCGRSAACSRRRSRSRRPGRALRRRCGSAALRAGASRRRNSPPSRGGSPRGRWRRRRCDGVMPALLTSTSMRAEARDGRRRRPRRRPRRR